MPLETIKEVTPAVIWVAPERHLTTISKNKVMVPPSYVVTLKMGKIAHLLINTSISVPTVRVLTRLEIVLQVRQLRDLTLSLYDLGDSALGSQSLCLVVQTPRLLAA